MLAQIVQALGPAAAGEVRGAADDDEGERLRQPYRDHVGGDELAQPYAGVESFSREVDQLLARGNLHVDLRIRPAEGCDQRLQQDRHHRARYSQAQQPSRPLSEFARGPACGNKLLEGGPCARKEAFAGFGKTDAARRADERHCADAPLECAYRLTNSRWRHPELRGCSAETAVLGNAQERLHAVERTLPDCEVLLHTLSILSRIVARGKRPYI